MCSSLGLRGNYPHILYMDPINHNAVKGRQMSDSTESQSVGIIRMLQGNELSSSTMPSIAAAAVDTMQTPVLSSIWLEQGEYFFDEEFAVPFDTHLRESMLTGTRQHGGPADGMINSLNTDFSASYHIQAPNGRSDSCLFTPADSGESGLNSAQTGGTPSYENVSQPKPSTRSSNTFDRHSYNIFSPSKAHISPSPSDPIGMNGCIKFSASTIDFNADDMVRSSSCASDASRHLIGDTSLTSGQSGSASWMQMLMERSCNPELKALLTRTAHTGDYKLAYGDCIPADWHSNSFIGHTGNDERPIENSTRQIGHRRSLSQTNLLTVASLAALRNVLERATQHFPKPVQPNLNVRSIGISVESNEIGCCEPVSAVNTSQEAIPSNTTTWAKKHGSRESLKRKSSTGNFTSVAATGAAAHPTPITAWRALKKASGDMVTWSQLKRTMHIARRLERATTVLNAHDISQTEFEAEPYEHTARDENYKKTCIQYRPVRSRSQPVSTDRHRHRFSGTLLEIFLRGRTDDATNVAHHSVGSVTTDIDMNFLLESGNVTNITHSPKIKPVKDSSQAPVLHKSPVLIPNQFFPEYLKHPLLRGDRILPPKFQPIDFSPMSVSMDNKVRLTHHFGAQFPPLDSSGSSDLPEANNAASPLYQRVQNISAFQSSGNTTPRTNVTLRQNCTADRDCQARYSPLSGRPQSYAFNGPLVMIPDQATNCHASPIFSSGVPLCLTSSAGPDSPYLTALRYGCLAEGYAPGLIGNPRASIDYPGLGLLSVPRPSRLTGATLISQTLPDLSFLSEAVAQEDRKGTPTMSKRHSGCHCCGVQFNANRRLSWTRRGYRSASTGGQCAKHMRPRNRPNAVKSKRVLTNCNDNYNELCSPNRLKQAAASHGRLEGSSVLTSVPPDLVIGHTGVTTEPESILARKIHGGAVDRSTSEPDLKSLSLDPRDVKFMSPLMTSSNRDYSEWECSKFSHFSSAYSDRRPKKSVSFSGNIRLTRPCVTRTKTGSSISPEFKVIPRHWGLYGQETPLAEFNSRNSPGRDTHSPRANISTRQSDVDVRYHAMVNDVIKAVQETVAYYSKTHAISSIERKTTGSETIFTEPLPYSAIAALGSAGRQPLLAVVTPLTVLLSDGLLPPTKPIFTTKPRTRLWQMVEESCRPGACPAGVAFHVLSDAVTQVKSLANITLERVKFKAFVCACLNAKALPMWLNAVVANTTLLRRFYCENAFIRQCRSTQRGLHADLMTHLEQLLAFPFNLDLATEARKPLTADPQLPPGGRSSLPNHPPGTGAVNTSPTSSANGTNQRQLHSNNQHPRSNVPPAVVMPRRQPINHGRGLNPHTKVSSPPRNSYELSRVHHYPQHHLPGQRANIIRTAVTAAARTEAPLVNTKEDLDMSSSASSEAVPGETKISQPKSTTPNNPSRVSQNQPVVSASHVRRGRFKTALSTFRRGSGSPTTMSPAKITGPSPAANGAVLGSRPNNSNVIPMSDSQSQSNNKRLTNTPARSSTTITTHFKSNSKLKQPTSMTNQQES